MLMHLLPHQWVRWGLVKVPEDVYNRIIADDDLLKRFIGSEFSKRWVFERCWQVLL